MDYSKKSLELHKKHHGKLEINSKFKIENKDDLSVAYTPGVAAVSSAIANDKSLARELTWKANTIAVISDGSAVLGLGNIGPEAALPVMEGKCILMKEFAGVDAVPVVLKTQDVEEIIKTIVNIAPTYSGINLEDISAPRCFEIEERLQQLLDIPVFHDDQHGTAIVILAALINSAKVLKRNLKEMKIVINGAGAAGIACVKLLNAYGVNNIIICDSQGIISKNRDDLNAYKQELLKTTNPNNISGNLTQAMQDSDVFIGLSIANVMTAEMVKSMNADPVIIAMANPVPEIMPDLAKKAGAKIVATGRSDFPNQVNNVLGFPGIFRGLLDSKVANITTKIKIAAAEGIASYVKKPTVDEILPSPLDKKVAHIVAKAVSA